MSAVKKFGANLECFSFDIFSNWISHLSSYWKCSVGHGFIVLCAHLRLFSSSSAAFYMINLDAWCYINIIWKPQNPTLGLVSARLIKLAFVMPIHNIL